MKEFQKCEMVYNYKSIKIVIKVGDPNTFCEWSMIISLNVLGNLLGIYLILWKLSYTGNYKNSRLFN